MVFRTWSRAALAPRERLVAADAVRLAGVLVVVAAALGGSVDWAVIPAVAALAAAGVAAGQRLARFQTPILLAEGAAAVLLSLAPQFGWAAAVYLLVPPMAAGTARGVRPVAWVSGLQFVLWALAVGSGRTSDPAVLLLLWIIMGFAFGLAGAVIGRAVHRAVTTLAAKAAYDERRRLAAEIHDGLGQDLAVIAHRIDVLLLDEEPTVPSSDVDAIGLEVRRTMHDTRWAIHDLRGGRLPEVGFGAALADHARRAAALCGLDVHLSITERANRLPVATQTELLRIAQEAVTNVRKHAGAANLWVTVEVASRGALLVVADDGRHRPREADGSFPTGFGISIMRERAERIGADFRYRGRAGGGTVVEVAVRNSPLRTSANRLLERLRGDRRRQVPSWV